MSLAARRRQQTRSQELNAKIWRWLEIASIVGLVLLFLGPMLLVVFSSIKPPGEVAREPFTIPETVTLKNFANAWVVGRFGRYLANTVIYTVSTIAGVSLLGSTAGYALARIKFPGSSIVFGLLLLGVMIPFQAIMIPLYFLLVDTGLIGRYAAMILSSIALGIPFAVFLMRQFFVTIDNELAEAARLDGASEWTVFRRVMLPLALPGLSTLAIFQFLFTWNSFILPLIVVPSEELRPVATGLIFFAGRYSSDQALISASIILMNLPVLVLYLSMQRFFIRSVTGAAKL